MPTNVQDNQSLSVDVIVVGGGLSGMTSAYRLQQAGLRVIVIEADNRIGGRLWTDSERDGGPLDLGGMFIGATHSRSIELGTSLGLHMQKARPEGAMLWRIDGCTYQTINGKYPDVPTVSGNLADDLNDSFTSINSLAEALGSDEPWNKKKLDYLDNETVESWLKDNVNSDLARRIHAMDLSIITGAESSEVSLMYWAYYVAQCENIYALQVTANDSLWTGGSQQLCHEIENRLTNKVHLNSPVTKIVQSDGIVTVESASSKFTASRVILAMPPAAANNICFEPQLPPQRRQLQMQASLGRYAKVQIRYRKRFWLDLGFSGEVFDLDTGFLSIDVTRDGDSVSTLACFIGGNSYDKWISEPPEFRKQIFLNALESSLGEQAKEFSEYIEVDWCNEPYKYGGPVTWMPPGLLSSTGKSLRNNIGKIYFAGTEASHSWNGYMEGAVIAGEIAAENILKEIN